MKTTTPKVYVLGSTLLHSSRSSPLPVEYEDSIGLTKQWNTDAGTDAEALIEAAGRICYKSWEPGLNPNVTKVRSGNANYLANVLEQRHGSVLEHVNVTFLFHNVSRVFTHELVRHRVGVAISQESLRYVRIDENSPMVLPPDVAKLVMDDALNSSFDADGDSNSVDDYTSGLGFILRHIADSFGINKPSAPFSLKKQVTSALRRFIGMGIATDMVWTANIRTLRHCLEMRTDSAAEWEMREVFGEVGDVCKELYPELFQDFVKLEDGTWCTYHLARALSMLGPLKVLGGDERLLIDPASDAVTVPRSWVKGWAGRMKGNA